MTTTTLTCSTLYGGICAQPVSETSREDGTGCRWHGTRGTFDPAKAGVRVPGYNERVFEPPVPALATDGDLDGDLDDELGDCVECGTSWVWDELGPEGHCPDCVEEEHAKWAEATGFNRR